MTRDTTNIKRDRIGRFAENPRHGGTDDLGVDDVYTRLERANSPDTDTHDVDRLLDDPVRGVALAAARRPDLTPEQLTRLSTHEDVRMRLAASEHRTLPAEALENLCRDRSSEIRRRMAFHNTDLTDEQKIRLSRDRSNYVRMDLAMRPDLPAEASDRLRNDGNAQVRQIAEAYSA